MELISNTALYDLAKGMNDHNFCTVVALAAVMDSDYFTCQKYATKVAGRVWRRGLQDNQVDKLFTSMKKTKWVKGPYSRSNRITVKQFCEKHPEGRYYVGSRGHAYAIIDGNVHDWKLGARRLINKAWRVYLEEDI